jgi:hypothetical protein
MYPDSLPKFFSSFFLNRQLVRRVAQFGISNDLSKQDCQIFLDTIYQNGEKYTNLLLNYQMALK